MKIFIDFNKLSYFWDISIVDDQALRKKDKNTVSS